jgi:hypothetical protein
MTISRILLVVLLLSAPDALAAQAADTTGAPAAPVVRATNRQRFERMVLPAALGSGVGLVAGALVGAGPFYESTGCCGGGDDPGLTSALWGAVAGATLGSALGAYLTRTGDKPVSFPRALLGATVGLGAGALLGAVGAQLDRGDPPGVLIGFSIGQGATTAAFAVPYP